MVRKDVTHPLHENDTITLAFQLEGQMKDNLEYVYTLVRDSTDTINLIDSDDEPMPSNFYESDPDFDEDKDSAPISVLVSAATVPERETVQESNELRMDENSHKQRVITTPTKYPHKLTENVRESSTSQIRNIAARFGQPIYRKNQCQAPKRKQACPDDAFKTKVKVKVAKFSRGEMLIADMLNQNRDDYNNF